ncbi:hypothetical protein [Geomonas ferrireducens]|nr:hypothetical protein [Geomonas ferrireducens]
MKLRLHDDRRTAQYGKSLIRVLLSKIQTTMDQMHEVMQTLKR